MENNQLVNSRVVGKKYSLLQFTTTTQLHPFPHKVDGLIIVKVGRRRNQSQQALMTVKSRLHGSTQTRHGFDDRHTHFVSSEHIKTDRLVLMKIIIIFSTSTRCCFSRQLYARGKSAFLMQCYVLLCTTHTYVRMRALEPVHFTN